MHKFEPYSAMKKEWDTDACNNLEKSQRNHAELNKPISKKPVSKGYIEWFHLYDSWKRQNYRNGEKSVVARD